MHCVERKVGSRRTEARLEQWEPMRMVVAVLIGKTGVVVVHIEDVQVELASKHKVSFVVHKFLVITN